MSHSDRERDVYSRHREVSERGMGEGGEGEREEWEVGEGGGREGGVGGR